MLDFLLTPATPDTVWIVIILTGVVTYFTRSVGYVVLSRFKYIHPRVEAALEAVPGAVLIALILPSALNNGPVEIIAMLAALVVSFRLSAMGVLMVGMVIVIAGRAFGF